MAREDTGAALRRMLSDGRTSELWTSEERDAYAALASKAGDTFAGFMMLLSEEDRQLALRLRSALLERAQILQALIWVLEREPTELIQLAIDRAHINPELCELVIGGIPLDQFADSVTVRA